MVDLFIKGVDEGETDVDGMDSSLGGIGDEDGFWGVSCLGMVKGLGEWIPFARSRSPNTATASLTDRKGRDVSTLGLSWSSSSTLAFS
ncbi:hypothetical protein Scep_002895 [Stephania cephalantha]|uniref:Uncharacterized protein n=1 Tax=Stephania cephalantha TaxID=152367 RepID=A0AAP0LG24_9MAGN